jgi:hypothetical protein
VKFVCARRKVGSRTWPTLEYRSFASYLLNSTDDSDLARNSCPNFYLPLPDTSWLSFHLQSIRLAIAARSVHDNFFSKSMKILASSISKDVYRDTKALESWAGLMRRSMEPLQVWAKDIPKGLKIKRKESGLPLSTDRTPLDIDDTDPYWIQLQRASLELSYHNTSVAFYRLFICFRPHHSSTTP